MTLPLSTTTVSVLRAAGLTETDSYDDPPRYEPVATGVRAVFGKPRGTERTDRAEASTQTTIFTLDPLPDGLVLSHLDRLYDESVGVTWRIQFCQDVTGVGLDHVTGRGVRYDGQQP